LDTALQSMVKSAAGTGAPTNASSRYYGSPVLTFAHADGTQVVPQPSIYTSLLLHPTVDGDRLDNLSSRYLGDPLLYWMICDANRATDPDALTAQVGHTISIPLASGIPPGARNG